MNKSYFKKYDSNKDTNNGNEFIIEKNKNFQYLPFENNLNDDNNDSILFQNKIEELLCKLKFLNSKKNFNQLYMDCNISNNISNDFNNKITNKIIKSNLNQTNIIDAIDNIIIKLNKQIINQAQIKRYNELIEFEF